MFNKVKLRPEITPKRVYALLKLVDYKNGLLKEIEIYDYIQPSIFSNDQKDVKLAFKFCKSNNLIDIDFDGKVILKMDNKFLKDEVFFRKFITNEICDDKLNNTFYLITEKILESNFEIYDFTGFENILLNLRVNQASKENILAWRFWAAFLGYGFILNNQFIINPHLKLKDFIEENFINKISKSKLTFGNFIDILFENCPEFNKSIKNNTICSHLSIAFITLENLNIIKLIEVKDSSEKWLLDLNNTNREFSHIEILGGE